LLSRVATPTVVDVDEMRLPVKDVREWETDGRSEMLPDLGLYDMKPEPREPISNVPLTKVE